MAKESQIDQLIEAVKRHPGSPAFALLAEHYLEQNQLDEAMRVCKEGFTANPSYERGVVAYLAVLRRQGDARTAGEVFGRAVAYLPRSAKLRLLWAMVLAEAGRTQEARRYAREAMNLDPLSRDARALVATLGDPVPSASHTREYAPMDTAKVAQEVEGLFDESEPGDAPAEEGDLSSQARAQRASVRPRIRPIGQRTTPHALFDLTPGPMPLDPQQPVSPRSLGGSPFDITPMPLIKQPPGPATAEETIEEIEAPIELELEEDEAPAPPQLPHPTDEPIVLTTTADLLEDLPTSRRRIWIPLVVVLVAGGAVGGYLLYRHVQDRAVRSGVQQALDLMLPDRLAGYRGARKQLLALRADHPDDPRVLAALALVDAHLLARFTGDKPLLAESRALLGRCPADGDQAVAATALLALYEGQPDRARAALGRLPAAGESWHATLARVLVAMRERKLDGARSLLERSTGPAATAPALLSEAAKLQRWCGHLERSRELVTRGLKASPGHPGLLIQAARLAVARHQTVGKAALARLARAAGELPRFRAALALVQADLAANRGAQAEAIALTEQAMEQQPDDLEAGTRLGVLLLGPGGDVNRALPLLERNGAAIAACDPRVDAWRVLALLLQARPHEAKTQLNRIQRDRLPQTDRDWIEELEVRSAHQADDVKAFDALCNRPGGNRQRLACVAALLERSRFKEATSLARELTSSRRFVRGLRALAQGDTSTAIAALGKVDPDGLPDPVAYHLALASAYARQGDPQRAVDILRKAVALDARSVRSQIALATALVSAGHDSEAQSILESVLQAKPTQPSILGRAGQTFLAVGLSKRALELIQHGIKFNSESTSIRLLAGRVSLANNRPEEAKAMFNEVLKRDPNSAEALVELGRIEAAADQRGQARKHFARALELRPADPDLLLLLARVHAQSGDYRNALEYGKRALVLLQKARQGYRVQETLVELGRTFRKGDKWAQSRAEELLFEATKPKAAPANAFLELGLLHLARHDLNRAAWCFKQAVQRDPGYAEGYLRLGQTLAKKPRWRKDARAALQQYLKLRPKGGEAARVRALLKRLR